MTRTEHMAWAKQRALDLVAAGDLQGAFASIASDLNKHEETRGHTGIHLGAMLLVNGHLDDGRKMRKFIEDFS